MFLMLIHLITTLRSGPIGLGSQFRPGGPHWFSTRVIALRTYRTSAAATPFAGSAPGPFSGPTESLSSGIHGPSTQPGAYWSALGLGFYRWAIW